MQAKSKITLGLAALAVAVLGMAGAAHAQTKPMNIAVFDTVKVMNGTNAYKRASTDLSAKGKAAQARIDALEKPLIEKRQKLISQQGVMAADKFQAAFNDLNKEVDTFRQQAQKIQAELDQQILASRKRISDGVSDAVEQIAKEKGYDMIVPKGMTIYTSTNVPDITSDTLVRANAILDK